MTRIFVPVSGVEDLAGYAAGRAARLGPLVEAVRVVLGDARGMFVEIGFVTSFIVAQIRTRFPHVRGVSARDVQYALNELERRGEAERVRGVALRTAGRDVVVNRWRRTRA